jgi:hypothetical protein
LGFDLGAFRVPFWPFEFKGLPELLTLEENLQMSRFDRERIHEFTERVKGSGPAQFFERMI